MSSCGVSGRAGIGRMRGSGEGRPHYNGLMLRVSTFAVALAGLLCSGALVALDAQDAADKQRPKLNLRSTPVLSFSPARVSFTAELRGGPDDYEELYCPTVEWDWDDGTQSESKQDCEPYEPGKSGIKRIYTMTHQYDLSGNYTVSVRLKRQSKVVGSATTKVQVRPGAREGVGG